MYQIILSIYACNARNRGQMASVPIILTFLIVGPIRPMGVLLSSHSVPTRPISENPLTLPGLSVPLCSAFLTTILEGQLCYELKLVESLILLLFHRR